MGGIVSARVGKHTDEFIAQLVVSTEGLTACLEWDTDGWGGYERVLGAEVDHYIGKTLTQRNERTNGILRQQTGRWHDPAKQGRQSVAADGGNRAIGCQLLQLDLAAFTLENNSSTTN